MKIDGEGGLLLIDELGIEVAFSVSGNSGIYFSEIGLHGLFAIAIR